MCVSNWQVKTEADKRYIHILEIFDLCIMSFYQNSVNVNAMLKETRLPWHSMARRMRFQFKLNDLLYTYIRMQCTGRHIEDYCRAATC